MNEAEAKKVLSALGFIPGTHKTAGRKPDDIQQIRKATTSLKRAGSLYRYAEEMLKQKKAPKKKAKPAATKDEG